MPVNKPMKVNAVVSFDDKTVTDTKTENERSHTTQEGIRKATWSAVVAASVYAFISIGMWCQMIGQNRILREQLKTAQESLVATQRAYVNVQEVKAVSFQIGKAPEAHVFYKNSGLTPATYVVAQPTMFIRGQKNGGSPEPQTSQQWLKCGHRVAMGAVLPPQISRIAKANNMILGDDPESLSIAIDVPLTKDDFEAVRQYKKRWYVVLYLSYWDGFGTFRGTAEPFEYDPNGGVFNAANFGWREANCHDNKPN